MKNAFGILVSRFRVLLGIMEQRPRVVRDIVFTCMVLHNMLRTHQGGEGRAPNPANDVASQQNELQESFEGGQTSTRTTQGLLQSHGGIGCAGGQDLRYVNQAPWVLKLASISPFQDYYQSFL